MPIMTVHTTAEKLTTGDRFYLLGYKKPWVCDYHTDHEVVCYLSCKATMTRRLSKGYPIYKEV